MKASPEVVLLLDDTRDQLAAWLDSTQGRELVDRMEAVLDPETRLRNGWTGRMFAVGTLVEIGLRSLYPGEAGAT